jgi:hypothetical protein
MAGAFKACMRGSSPPTCYKSKYLVKEAASRLGYPAIPRETPLSSPRKSISSILSFADPINKRIIGTITTRNPLIRIPILVGWFDFFGFLQMEPR